MSRFPAYFQYLNDGITVRIFVGLLALPFLSGLRVAALSMVLTAIITITYGGGRVLGHERTNITRPRIERSNRPVTSKIATELCGAIRGQRHLELVQRYLQSAGSGLHIGLLTGPAKEEAKP